MPNKIKKDIKREADKIPPRMKTKDIINKIKKNNDK